MEDKELPFRVAGVYDTETTNIQTAAGWRAFPILFIYNDLRDCSLEHYTYDVDDNVTFYRCAGEFIARIEETIAHADGEYIPIVCAYNLMFDLQPIQYTLAQRYKCKVCAQSSTHVYTFDLCDKDENILLRFWDCYYLETRGLRAMGECAGLPKACGEWDYSLIRTPETPLTDNELFYAKRDVQVIPAYLNFLLQSNSWLTSEMLGYSVITKTSIVRQMAKHTFSNLRFHFKNGKSSKLGYAFEYVCNENIARTYNQYAIRRACFRGGFTFTSARFAHLVMPNVASLDVTSMHHLFINGQMQPYNFRAALPTSLKSLAEIVVSTPLSKVLVRYYQPFNCAFHAYIQFTNLRLKEGSAFEAYEIGLLSQAKFHLQVKRAEGDLNQLNIEAENDTRALGFVDYAEKAVFAYGKLMSAETACVYITELELYAISLVYDYDAMEAIAGELSTSFKRPCDYVTLQSNYLFEQKQAAKEINKYYEFGKPYTRQIRELIEAPIAEGLKRGTLSNNFVSSWYNSTIKGAFNGIYGTQAMNEFRPEYAVFSDGELAINEQTRVTPYNFDAVIPDKSKVHYTYGMRIVGGSRLHLVIAIKLLYNAFGEDVKILAGDTDSIKCSVDASITDTMLLEALAPLHNAATNAINYVQQRVRRDFQRFASPLTNVGHFEIETCNKVSGSTRYLAHMELWNKARVSYDGEKVHVTCAGLPRPENAFNIEDFLQSFLDAGYSFYLIAPIIFSYNTTVDNTICHTLERYQPAAADILECEITDYLGCTSTYRGAQSVALYNASRILGDSFKIANALNLAYQKHKGRREKARFTTICTTLRATEKECIIEGTYNKKVLYKCKRNDIKD